MCLLHFSQSSLLFRLEISAKVAAVTAERDRALSQLHSLQAHLLQLENSHTEEALRRDEHLIKLQAQIRLNTEQAESELSQQIAKNHQLARQLDLLEAEIVKARRSRDELDIAYKAANAECQRLGTTVANLELVFQNFEVEKEAAVTLAKANYEHQLRDLEAKLQAAAVIADQHHTCELQMQAHMQTEQTLRGDLNLSRGMNSALQHDIVRIQTQLSEVQAKLQATTDVFVDKALVRNMVTT